MRCRERVWREVPARLGGARRPEADGRGWGAVGRSDAPRRACVCGAAGAGTQGHVVTCLHCFSREDCLHSLPSYVRCEMLGVTPGSGSCWPQRAPPRGFCSLVPSPPQPRPAAPRFDGRPQPLPVSPPHLLWRTCCRVSWLHNPPPPQPSAQIKPPSGRALTCIPVTGRLPPLPLAGPASTSARGSEATSGSDPSL